MAARSLDKQLRSRVMRSAAEPDEGLLDAMECEDEGRLEDTECDDDDVKL